MTRVFECASIAETESLGRAIGEKLMAGMVLALNGPLGAGKTHLTRAIAEGLGVVDVRLVTSPTFVIVQEYSARLSIFHFDLYRLNNNDEVEDLGFNEYLNAGGVCIIEWADKFPHCLPSDYLRIDIETTAESSRRFAISTIGTDYDSWLAGIESSGSGLSDQSPARMKLEV